MQFTVSCELPGFLRWKHPWLYTALLYDSYPKQYPSWLLKFLSFSLVTQFFYLASHLGSSSRLTASSLWWDSLRPREGRLPREHPSFAPSGGAQRVQPRPQLEANYCHKISTADFQHPAFVQMLWEGGTCLGEAGKRSYF